MRRYIIKLSADGYKFKEPSWKTIQCEKSPVLYDRFMVDGITLYIVDVWPYSRKRAIKLGLENERNHTK